MEEVQNMLTSYGGYSEVVEKTVRFYIETTGEWKSLGDDKYSLDARQIAEKILNNNFVNKKFVEVFPEIKKYPSYHFLNVKNQHLLPLITKVLREMQQAGEIERVWNSRKSIVRNRQLKETLYYAM